LLRQGFPYLTVEAIHSMGFLNDNLVYRIMVIKCYKSKASLFATVSVTHDFNRFNFPILFEVIS